MDDAIEFHTARTDAAQVLLFPQDRGRRRVRCYVLYGVDDVAPKKCAAKIKFSIECSYVHASFGSSQTFGIQKGIVQSQDVGLTECPVEFVERGGAKSAVHRGGNRHMLGQRSEHR